ncbi:endonuclease domain-containing protein [Candidatus Gracilibacteria bacterium]|nr:endonuclease domain-containing protein [Candidatus Gracilibacteria bacterium]
MKLSLSMKPPFERFIFENFSFVPQTKKLILEYSLDQKITFREEFVFPFEFAPHYEKKALEQAMFGAFVMCGISYYKAFLPPKIEFSQNELTASQAQFFQKTWERGLGEFFYRNNLPTKGSIPFSASGKEAPVPVQIKHLEGSLVPLGGGKDSLVSAELLKEADEEFETWTVGDFPFLNPMTERIGTPHLRVKRTLDPRLFELNEAGALNGHIPISAILAFLGVASAILRGRKNVILSNEHSANEPTVGDVNHQYSKSLEFEQNFQNYVCENISPDINYFSLLRPLSELKIAEIFVHKCWKKYSRLFASCNTNYQLRPLVTATASSRKQWCGNCPKCAFVFSILAPFVPREELVALFGKNLFEDKNLESTFYELLGMTESKPFECVGEIEEVRYALEQARKNFPESAKFQFPASKFDPKKMHPSSMPERFTTLLTQHTSCHPEFISGSLIKGF